MKAFVQALRLETRLCRGTYQTGYALLRVCAGAVVGRRGSFSFLVRSFAINTKKNLVPGWRHRSVLFTHVNRPGFELTPRSWTNFKVLLEEVKNRVQAGSGPKLLGWRRRREALGSAVVSSRGEGSHVGEPLAPSQHRRFAPQAQRVQCAVQVTSAGSSGSRADFQSLGRGSCWPLRNELGIGVTSCVRLNSCDPRCTGYPQSALSRQLRSRHLSAEYQCP